ncbi:MAG TPA: hypothetical protein VG871_21555, partial [Vicinamibacterales bacterium]|nr:hypothetical protein [Vicinamibacterales bacterium]
WEKDGDYNTGSSSTVLPLPTHARATYAARGGALVLEDDPVYRQHADDWTRFHTRYVTPAPFLRGLSPARRAGSAAGGPAGSAAQTGPTS